MTEAGERRATYSIRTPMDTDPHAYPIMAAGFVVVFAIIAWQWRTHARAARRHARRFAAVDARVREAVRECYPEAEWEGRLADYDRAAREDAARRPPRGPRADP